MSLFCALTKEKRFLLFRFLLLSSSRCFDVRQLPELLLQSFFRWREQHVRKMSLLVLTPYRLCSDK